MLREAPLEENRKRELSSALHVYFKDWLYGKSIISIFFVNFIFEFPYVVVFIIVYSRLQLFTVLYSLNKSKFDFRILYGKDYRSDDGFCPCTMLNLGIYSLYTFFVH